MDYELIKTGALVLSMLSNCVIGAIAIDARRQRVTTKAIDELHKRIDEKCLRLARLEGELKAAPSRDELMRIHERIDELNLGNKETNLLLGKVAGQIDQMSQRLMGK